MERLWAKVNKRGPDECWPWLGAKLKAGYGHIKVAGAMRLVTRVLIEHSGPAVLGGMYVMHSCDNPSCCNPAHLKVGTPSDNTQDMLAKGRGPVGIRRSAEARAKMSAAKKGRKLPEAIVAARRGRVVSLEAREKMRCTHLARWARLKAQVVNG